MVWYETKIKQNALECDVKEKWFVIRRKNKEKKNNKMPVKR